jgi:hypothetical protein
MTELEVTAFEELDLLIKWLGLESAQQATSIRASYVLAVQIQRENGFGRVWMTDMVLQNPLKYL